ncbi:DUF6882 domain-containing protein, partial [Nocardia brasiliensis]|uniref:DUF6882 domain-containing protein n=1 Tax=Nocardia brasiliensis TaxID=37326 RepID=UPI003D7784B0
MPNRAYVASKSPPGCRPREVWAIGYVAVPPHLRGAWRAASAGRFGIGDRPTRLGVRHARRRRISNGSDHRGHVTYEPPLFELFGDHPLACTRFHVLGTAAPGPRSWLWSWANYDWYPSEVTELARS